MKTLRLKRFIARQQLKVGGRETSFAIIQSILSFLGDLAVNSLTQHVKYYFQG